MSADFHYPQPRESLAQFARRVGVQGRRSTTGSAAVHAYRLPRSTAGCAASTAESLLYTEFGEEACWSGWGYLAGSWLLAQEEPLVATRSAAGLPPKTSRVHIRSSQMLDARSLAAITRINIAAVGTGAKHHPNAPIAYSSIGLPDRARIYRQ